MQNFMDTITSAFSKQDMMDSIQDVFDFPQEEIDQAFLRGLEVATVTIAATLLLEVYSFGTTKIILSNNKVLYFQAVVLNFINHYLYGIPVYMASSLFLVRKVDEDYSYGSVALQVLGIMIVQSISYYSAHKMFHTAPGMYKYHKFHHRFHTDVTPMVANAVGFVEYWLAYILPFALAGAILNPYEDSVRLALYITSFTNLSIHTPKIEAWSEQNMPSFWVSTHGHLEHHKKLTVHYGAPTWNVDWFVAKLSGEKNL
ncbi:expressed unknown protein [Seminavis robusta]|uniref:Fatty acid hydroxylase domain-containing protein n=1 Tax=Seminavis robusta TaxID=568900 RepID=A0A9N8EEY6_9STRA|nr:expressed unknown protein [Seminavis robusta]|eukprot:Sro1086_g239730.1 n/a (257) ;mRNA; f:18325-19095